MADLTACSWDVQRADDLAKQTAALMVAMWVSLLAARWDAQQAVWSDVSLAAQMDPPMDVTLDDQRVASSADLKAALMALRLDDSLAQPLALMWACWSDGCLAIRWASPWELPKVLTLETPWAHQLGEMSVCSKESLTVEQKECSLGDCLASMWAPQSDDWSAKPLVVTTDDCLEQMLAQQWDQQKAWHLALQLANSKALSLVAHLAEHLGPRWACLSEHSLVSMLGDL